MEKVRTAGRMATGTMETSLRELSKARALSFGAAREANIPDHSKIISCTVMGDLRRTMTVSTMENLLTVRSTAKVL